MFSKDIDCSVKAQNNQGTIITGSNNTLNITYINHAYIPIKELLSNEKAELKYRLVDDFIDLRVYNSDHSLAITDYQSLSLFDDLQKCFINEDELLNQINQVDNVELLITGDIGSGKTTLMKYLIYQYLHTNKLDKYDLIFYIDLENMKEDTNDIQTLLNAQYVHYLDNVTQFKYSFNKSKTLFIFDGLDKIKSTDLKEQFYKIKKSINNKIIISRNNSIDINQIKRTGFVQLNGFRDIEDIQMPISEYDLENSSSTFINYLKKLFKNHSLEELLELCYFLVEENLLDLVKNPLIMTALYDKKYQYLTKLNLLHTINDFLISQYSKNIYNLSTINLKAKTYPERKQIIKNKLFTIAYKAYKQPQNNITPDINPMSYEEFEYILRLGYLKTKEFGDDILALTYDFIHSFFQSIFVAENLYLNHEEEEYYKAINTILEDVLQDTDDDILMFLNMLCLDSQHKELLDKIHQNIIKIIDELEQKEQIEKVLSILFNTNIILHDFDKRKEKKYEHYIKNQNSIQQSNLKYQLNYIENNYQKYRTCNV